MEDRREMCQDELEGCVGGSLLDEILNDLGYPDEGSLKWFGQDFRTDHLGFSYPNVLDVHHGTRHFRATAVSRYVEESGDAGWEEVKAGSTDSGT